MKRYLLLKKKKTTTTKFCILTHQTSAEETQCLSAAFPGLSNVGDTVRWDYTKCGYLSLVRE